MWEERERRGRRERKACREMLQKISSRSPSNIDQLRFGRRWFISRYVLSVVAMNARAPSVDSLTITPHFGFVDLHVPCVAPLG